MDPLFYQILSQWCFQEMERSKDLPQLPGYPGAQRDLLRAQDRLLACLEGPSSEAFGSYEEARNHIASLGEDAAFLAGLRTGLRLCLRL